MSQFDDASLILIPSLYKAGKLYAAKPTDGSGDFDVVRAGTVNDVGPNGVLRNVANNVPVLSYNDDRSFRGVRVQPAGTNHIRNNTMVGAVAGTPGTLPTNWLLNNGSGMTTTVVGTGVENGIEYIEIRVNGTSNSSQYELALEGFLQTAASPGQIWTFSTWFKVVAAPAPPNEYRIRMREQNVGGFIGWLLGTFVPTTTLTRYSLTATTSAGITGISPFILFGVTNGVSYDFTFRIGLPQMEQTSVATSVIKTTGSTANRVIDSIRKTSATALIGQTEGTIYAHIDCRNRSETNARGIVYLSDGTISNRLALQFGGASDEIQFIVSVGGVSQASISINSNPSGLVKIAAAYKENDFVLYVNGTQIGTDVSGTVPACNQIDYAQLPGSPGVQQLNDRLGPLVLYKERLSNSRLAALTTP